MRYEDQIPPWAVWIIITFNAIYSFGQEPHTPAAVPMSTQPSTHHGIPQPFYGPFSGTIRVSWCQRRTSGLYGARKD